MATSPTFHQIHLNLQQVQQRIAAAAQRSGRQPEDVQLVAVTKQHPFENIQALLDAGQRMLGENRVHEVVEKMDYFNRLSIDPPIDWHFIGHLQTNKVRKLVGRISLFHGVDSLHLAEAVQKAADSNDCTADILLEVNVSGEASKYGMAPRDVEKAVDELKYLDRVQCLGLMTMAPWELEPEETRPVFRDLRELRDRLRDKGYDHLDLKHLSMGMTNDFEVAIEEGATMVRVGTALFRPF